MSVATRIVFKIRNTFTEWAEFLAWETTPLFTDEEAGPICAKINSQIKT